MICSISTGKCGSNWLDRLRSNKGFPVGDDLEIDHFLESKESDPKSNSPESTQFQKAAAEICGESGGDKGEWFGIMNNVLSDLFIMGESRRTCRFPRKKNSRKQTNPKICLVSRVTSSIEDDQEQSSGGCLRKDEYAQIDNALTEEVEREEIMNDVETEECEREELLGYSRNEVTVIDTSCMEWKFEKLLYRKRNDWKVREKKQKSSIIGFGRKRRKSNEAGTDSSVYNKKKFKLNTQEDDTFSSRLNPQAEEGEEVCEETSTYSNHVVEKRLQLSWLPKNVTKGGNSAILRSKKIRAKCPKSPISKRWN